MPVEGDDARAQGAIGLDDPGRRRLHARMGPVTSAATMSWAWRSSMMARDSLPALPLDPREVPDPEASSCHMSWMLTSSRPVHWLRLLLGPRPKIPAWIYMPPGSGSR